MNINMMGASRLSRKNTIRRSSAPLKLRLKGKDAGKLSDDERTSLRRTTIGFVYQYHHLLPEFSAMENIAIPQMIAGITRKEAESRARELLNLVGASKSSRGTGGMRSKLEAVRTATAVGVNVTVLLDAT